jgi:hypothetical protein
MRASVVSLTHRMAGREPPKTKKIDVATVSIIDAPLPPRRRPNLIPKGQGPWQRLSARMSVGQSVILPKAKAESFIRSCRFGGIKTARRQIDEHDTQVQIVSKP